MPITCTFGIFGNLLTLYVMLANGKKFNGYIFLYMKGLAIIDILQIIQTAMKLPFAVILHKNDNILSELRFVWDEFSRQIIDGKVRT